VMHIHGLELESWSKECMERTFVVLRMHTGECYTCGGRTSSTFGQQGRPDKKRSRGLDPRKVLALDGLNTLVLVAGSFHWLALIDVGLVQVCGLGKGS